jgi:hypothetical protein
MEGTLEAIVDGLTSVLLVFEETQADPHSHMVVSSTDDIANVVDSLAAIAPESVRGAPADFKKSAEELVKELHLTKQNIQVFSDRQLSKDEGAAFIGDIDSKRSLIIISRHKTLTEDFSKSFEASRRCESINYFSLWETGTQRIGCVKTNSCPTRCNNYTPQKKLNK